MSTTPESAPALNPASTNVITLVERVKLGETKDGKDAIQIKLRMPKDLKDAIVGDMTGSHSDKNLRTSPLINIAAIVDKVTADNGDLKDTTISYDKKVNEYSLLGSDMTNILEGKPLAKVIAGSSIGGSRATVRRYKSIRRKSKRKSLRTSRRSRR